MIKTTNLNKYFNKGKRNEIHVVNNANIELPNKGFITILGESGSGKTTLLNVIGGLDRFKGTIQYDDKVINDYNMTKMDEYRGNNIGYIFQNYNLLSNISVYDNLKLQLEIIDITDKEEVKKRIDYALTVVGLYKYRKKKPNELSGGQQQRVSIARALVKKYKILICDEPTGNLDSQNSFDVMKILKKISKTTLVLLVTHDKKLADFYSDRIYKIVDGKITDVVELEDNNRIIDIEDNNIYLQDMNCVSEGSNVKTTLYTTGENKNINIELVEVNGTYYLKSNVNIKFQAESNLKFVDAKKEVKNLADVEQSIEFDNSFYDDSKRTKPFKKFLLLNKEGFNNFTHVNKKSIFFKIVFIVIGIFLAIFNMNVINNTKINTENYMNDDRLYACIKEDDTDKYISKYNDKSYALSTVSIGKYSTMAYYINVNFTEVVYATYGNELAETKGSLLCGRYADNTNEVVIDKLVAKRIMKNLNISDMKLLEGFKLDNSIITGILDAETNMMYYGGTSFGEGNAYMLTSDEVKDLKEHGYKVNTYRQFLINNQKAQQRKARATIFSISFVFLAIIVVYIILTMRSKLIADVKRIGILRSIGMKRFRILYTNSVDILLTTLIFAVPSYFITTGIIQFFISNFGIILSSTSTNLFTTYITYLSIFGLFIIALIFGLLPIKLLLNKTPNEINTKYDI